MILSGLWFGSNNKPIMNSFLSPLKKSLSDLEKGLSIDVGDEKITVKAFMLCLSCDTPARSAVLNMRQHNGEFSCPKCLQKGENRTGKGGNIRIFPYQTEDPTGPVRNSAGVLSDAVAATERKYAIHGIKGPSVLLFLPQVDCVKNVGVDYMHLIFLGTVRLLLSLWFDVSHRLEIFSLYGSVSAVDTMLSNIKRSHFVTRKPRSINDLKFWKASELRSWFFYYSVPCVLELMKPEYLYHFCAFVEGVFLLNQASISEADISKSEVLLKYFVYMFAERYGDRYLTLNVHCLLHLPQTVRELGPLWATSCFAFEGANGELLQLFHGTQCIDIQIVNAVHIFQKLPCLSQKLASDNQASSFVNRLCKTDSFPLGDRLYGKAYQANLNNVERTAICGLLKKPIHKLSFHKRAVIRGIMFHSKAYTRTTNRNSYTVKYITNLKEMGFGFVNWFAEHIAENEEKELKFACVSRLEKVSENVVDLWCKDSDDCFVSSNALGVTVSHMHALQMSGKQQYEIIPLGNILDLCICLNHNDRYIVCEEPNHYELNL